MAYLVYGGSGTVRHMLLAIRGTWTSHKALAASFFLKSRSIRPLSLVDYFSVGGSVVSPIGCFALFFSLLHSGLSLTGSSTSPIELGVNGLLAVILVI